MSRIDIINKLYRKMSSTENRRVSFDQMMPPAPLSYFFSYQDVKELNRIAKSNKLAANPKEKFRLINNIMTYRI